MNVKVNIKKPMYDNYVSIRRKYINEAIRKGVDLEITTPNGTGTVDPEYWVATGKRIEKVFKRPDCPMILIANHVPIHGGML